jgi:putative DNA primase/helicase
MAEPKATITGTGKLRSADAKIKGVGEVYDAPIEAVDRIAEPSEQELAAIFVRRFGHRMRHVKVFGQWLLYNDGRWNKVETDYAYDCAAQICRWASRALLENNKLDSVRRRLTTAKMASAVERLAAASIKIDARSDQWDSNKMLLNTPGGTVDLRTGKLRAHDPEDHMTKCTSVTPDFDIDCPKWKKHLALVTQNDLDYIAYLQRLFGYFLTGETGEHSFYFAHGHDGRNGKGATIDTVVAIMNDYAINAPAELFAASKFERHSTERARLQGARLVEIAETKEGQAWNESFLSQVTGGNKITARYMRENDFTFIPECKVFIQGNHKLRLSSQNEAMKSRVKLLPFTKTIPEADRIKDFSKTVLVPEEGPAILAWMIEGCLKWQKKGLGRPVVVGDATAQYFADEDVFSQWLETCCKLGPNEVDTHKALFDSWKAYAKETNEPEGTSRGFGQKLRERGFEPASSIGDDKAKGFKGLKAMM